MLRKLRVLPRLALLSGLSGLLVLAPAPGGANGDADGARAAQSVKSAQESAAAYFSAVHRTRSPELDAVREALEALELECQSMQPGLLRPVRLDSPVIPRGSARKGDGGGGRATGSGGPEGAEQARRSERWSRLRELTRRLETETVALEDSLETRPRSLARAVALRAAQEARAVLASVDHALAEPVVTRDEALRRLTARLGRDSSVVPGSLRSTTDSEGRPAQFTTRDRHRPPSE